MAGEMELLAQLFGNGGNGAPSASGLNEFQQTIAANDPWSIAAAPVLGTKLNSEGWTPNQTLGAVAAQALMGTILKTVGQHSQASQMASLAEILPSLYSDPLRTARPEGMDAEAFSKLQSGAVLQGLASKSAAAARQKAMGEELFLKLFGKKAEVMGENAAYNEMGQGGTNPNSPAFKNAAANDARITDARDFLRLEGASYKDARGNMDSMMKNFDVSSPATDLAYAIAANKIWDPGAIVRDSDVQNIQAIVPLLEKNIKGFKNYITPEGTISKAGKLALMQAVSPKLEALGNNYKSVYDIEHDRIKKLSGDPSMIAAMQYQPFDLSPFENSMKADFIAQLKASGIDKETGRKMYLEKFPNG